ncbi:hypothetical protein SAMN05421781_1623 [Marinococcus luteus]|uniref:Uncharacterized protein n=1 Tax=Marinococcus luteus TaxID=1122204 RepID=A0A1H2U9G0_9BACI|nr:hypothetical protein [Marinococcus luteus]SDW52710.1 hypothetical protein SAMN05421781_1623 [Marinococcus luteus]
MEWFQHYGVMGAVFLTAAILVVISRLPVRNHQRPGLFVTIFCALLLLSAAGAAAYGWWKAPDSVTALSFAFLAAMVWLGAGTGICLLGIRKALKTSKG